MDDFKQFQSKLSTHRVTPPESGWNSLEKKLISDQRASSNKLQHMKQFLLGIAACALVVVMFKVFEVNNQDQLLRSGQVASWEALEIKDGDVQLLHNVNRLDLAYTNYLNGLRGNQSSLGTKNPKTIGTN